MTQTPATQKNRPVGGDTHGPAKESERVDPSKSTRRLPVILFDDRDVWEVGSDLRRVLALSDRPLSTTPAGPVQFPETVLNAFVFVLALMALAGSVVVIAAVGP